MHVAEAEETCDETTSDEAGEEFNIKSHEFQIYFIFYLITLAEMPYTTAFMLPLVINGK